MPNPVFVEFGEWAPDRMDWNNPGSPNIKNVIPDDYDGYLQQDDIDPFTNSLTAYCRGAFATKAPDDTSYVYAGDETTLYALANATFSSIARTAGYTCATDDLWDFTNFRNVVLASNYADEPQFMSVGGTLMQDIPASGSPPKCKNISTFGRFVTALNTNESDGAHPNRFRWSAIDDYTSWTASPTTLADYEDLDENGGPGRGLVTVGGRHILFQEKAISIASFVGPPIVMQIDKIEAGRGLLARKAMCVWGGVVYYLSQDGFYALVGGSSQPIGAGKINRWFFNDLDVSNINRISCAPDPRTGLIYWAYPGSDSSGGNPNRMLAFNPKNGRWTYQEPADLEFIFIAASAGYTLETLDNVSSSIDTLPESLDSAIWKGGELQFSGFDSNSQMGFFSGSALTAVLDTKETELGQGNWVSLQGIKPIADGGTHTIEIGYRRTIASGLIWTGSIAEQSRSGICPVRITAPYMRARLSITGGFNNAKGVYFYANKVSLR